MFKQCRKKVKLKNTSKNCDKHFVTEYSNKLPFEHLVTEIL